MPEGEPEKIRLGISACLLGEKVRYDGGHKRDPFLTETLGPFVEWVAVCPEVEIGLSTPRDTVRLVGDEDAPRLVVEKTGQDLTERMRRYARDKVEQLAALNLHGYVLKRASPSCGLFRVRVYPESGIPQTGGRGLFAAELAQRLPRLPVEEEGRLNDSRIRENSSSASSPPRAGRPSAMPSRSPPTSSASTLPRSSRSLPTGHIATLPSVGR